MLWLTPPGSDRRGRAQLAATLTVTLLVPRVWFGVHGEISVNSRSTEPADNAVNS